ncbi:MAG: MFS transporter [Ruminococcaceae bacterium]|nr:MFS transporter [Oscillospiraceae bacterium]
MNVDRLPMDPKRIQKNASNLFLLCFLSYTCSYLGRKNFSACLPAMIAEEFITKTMGGYITTAYMLCYGTGQLLSGVIGSRVKPKYMLSIGLFGAGLCNLAMGLLPFPAVLPLVWAANGLFHSMLWSPIIRIFTDLLPEERRSAAGTNIAVSCSLGAVLAFLIPGILLNVFSWQIVFFVSGGILLGCFLFWVLGNRMLAEYIHMMESACAQERAQQNTPEQSITHSSRHSRALPAVIISSGLGIVMLSLVFNGALRDAVETWAPTLLSEQFDIKSSYASLISVIIPVVSVAGTYVANFLYETFIHNELYTACTMFGVATLGVGGLYLFRSTSIILCAICMAISVSAMWGANHMYLTVIPYHFASVGLSAAITGTLNSMIYFATALCSGLYGILAEALGWHWLMIIWMALGLSGAILALIGGRVWAEKSLSIGNTSLSSANK